MLVRLGRHADAVSSVEELFNAEEFPVSDVATMLAIQAEWLQQSGRPEAALEKAATVETMIADWKHDPARANDLKFIRGTLAAVVEPIGALSK